MKKIFIIILATAMAVSFSSCSSPKKTPDVAAMMTTLRSELDLPDMADISKDRISMNYEIAQEDIADMAYAIASSGATTDEILIIKMTDKEKTADVKEQMDARKAQISDLFKTYNPAEMPKVDDCVIETNGEYAFFAICNDNAAAKKIFKDSF